MAESEKKIRFEKHCRIINGIFIAAMLVIFLAFLILLMKVKRGIPHFIMAGVLAALAVAYKFVDDHMKKRRLEIFGEISGRNLSELHMILRQALYDNDSGELKKFFEARGEKITVCETEDCGINISGRFGERDMTFNIGIKGIKMTAFDGDEITATRKAAYDDLKTIEKLYNIIGEFISRNY